MVFELEGGFMIIESDAGGSKCVQCRCPSHWDSGVSGFCSLFGI